MPTISISDGERIDGHLGPASNDEEVRIPPGTYPWDGDMDISSGGAVIGEGERGDVVLELDSNARMHPSVRGHLENIVVRGANGDDPSGIYPYPGATIDGFIWPEGGQLDRDRGMYTSDGGSETLTIRNSGIAGCVNNGMYIDKPPVLAENTVAINNNISGIRVGHREDAGTPDPMSHTTYVRNCLLVITETPPKDASQSGSNGRGVRFRHPGNFVVENCWFYYKDVSGAGFPIVAHDGAAGSHVTIRNCTFYNDSSKDLVRDKTGGRVDWVIENCTVAGSGSRDLPSHTGSGVSEDPDLTIPLPSAVTGYSALDEARGIDPSDLVWTSDPTTVEPAGTLFEVISNQSGGLDYAFTATGPVTRTSTSSTVAAGPNDTITDNQDGTYTVTGFTGNTGYGDAYRVEGSITSFTHTPNDFDFTLRWDGEDATGDLDLIPPSDDGDSTSGDDSTDDTTGDDTTVPTSDLTEEEVAQAIAEYCDSEIAQHVQDHAHLTAEEVQAMIDESVDAALDQLSVELQRTNLEGDGA